VADAATLAKFYKRQVLWLGVELVSIDEPWNMRDCNVYFIKVRLKGVRALAGLAPEEPTSGDVFDGLLKDCDKKRQQW
jgi:hypothetical protein